MLNKLIVSAIFLAAIAPAYGVNETRLWLPVKYHKYFLDLKEAAEAAEALENCSEVLKGVMDLDRSEKDHPIFRIQCRRPDGISYNEMVDGVSKETLTTKVIEETLTEEELEQLRLAEEQRIEQEKKQQQQRFAQECERVFKERTRFMLEMQRLTGKEPTPEEFSMEAALFSFDFNAESVSGQGLKYQAICNVRENEEQELKAELTIKARKLE